MKISREAQEDLMARLPATSPSVVNLGDDADGWEKRFIHDNSLKWDSGYIAESKTISVAHIFQTGRKFHQIVHKISKLLATLRFAGDVRLAIEPIHRIA